MGLKAIVESSNQDVQVETADSFTALLRLVDRGCGGIAVVDLDLPGMNGMAGLPTVLRHKPIPKLCVVMPLVTRDTVSRCISLGVLACIERTRVAEEVCSAVAALVDGRPFFSKLGEERRVGPTAATPVLTQQQLKVLRVLATGKSNKQIGRELGICEGTVKVHLNGAYRALGVNNRVAAVGRLRELSRNDNRKDALVAPVIDAEPSPSDPLSADCF